DIGENPARLLRYLNQWIQSGALEGVKAIILGKFTDCKFEEVDFEATIWMEFKNRLEIPIFESPDFGHISPNMPIMIGATAEISENKLLWHV
ncbi:MAG: hypothetical protein HQK54_13035, partial [Oligoflexales bacterium]|nr:hypothetical protein [Oligoflexales bacterium]